MFFLAECCSKWIDRVSLNDHQNQLAMELENESDADTTKE
jgi:hypothetical protein